MQTIEIASFYKFSSLTPERVSELSQSLSAFGERFQARGLCIMGTEGINATFSVASEQAGAFKAALTALLDIGELPFKISYAGKHPFHEFSVKVRDEIVTLSRTDLVPGENHRHLSPEEWHKTLEEENVVVIDTRNSYEYDIGHFKKAVNPNTREFNEFPKWLKTSGIEKDKKVLIYCTGGIRCEKAIMAMEEQGYKNVHQLSGGILNYLAEYPQKQFEGECFVFDYRVAVDQDLKPSQAYRLCPHCGQPAKTRIDCRQCGVEEIVCDTCLNQSPDLKTCSKNCAHHFRMGHKSKRIHQDAFRKREAIS